MAGTMEFWFRRKYSLTPSDPRFLDMTVEGMMSEFWAHHYFDNPKAAEQEVEDADFDLDAELERLNKNPDEWEPLG